MNKTTNPNQTYPEGTTPLIALFMLRGAESYLGSLLPRSHNLYEHPELHAAIEDLQIRSRELGRELRGAVKAA